MSDDHSWLVVSSAPKICAVDQPTIPNRGNIKWYRMFKVTNQLQSWWHRAWHFHLWTHLSKLPSRTSFFDRETRGIRPLTAILRLWFRTLVPQTATQTAPVGTQSPFSSLSNHCFTCWNGWAVPMHWAVPRKEYFLERKQDSSYGCFHENRSHEPGSDASFKNKDSFSAAALDILRSNNNVEITPLWTMKSRDLC